MRIGFIAMSGIRACDEELLALGLTLPGFVEHSKAIASLPSLGLLTLAGMTPSHHERRYLEVQEIGQLDPVPVDLDLVAISSLSAQVAEAYALADRYHAAGIPVVMGGLHVTACPDEPARHGAVAAVGEGELIWPEIVADAEVGQLKPRYDSRSQEFDLAGSPMPAYELLDMARYNRVTVQTSRGCPWRRTFCASSILLTSCYKQNLPSGCWRRWTASASSGPIRSSSWRTTIPSLIGCIGAACCPSWPSAKCAGSPRRICPSTETKRYCS